MHGLLVWEADLNKVLVWLKINLEEYMSVLHGPDAKDLICMAQDQEAQVARKKRRSAARVQTRSITGASLEVLCPP